MTNSEADVLFNELPGKGGKLGQIVLNRPTALNALNLGMINSMMAQLMQWQQDKNIKGVLIESNSERAFCAGGDLRHTHSAMEAFFYHEYRLNKLIYHYPKPYISFLDGITMGGGVGVSIHGSHRVVTEKVLFAMPETGIGFFPDVGGTYFLPRLIKHSGYYLGLTGARIKNADCVMLGIAQCNVAHDLLANLRDALVSTEFGQDAKAGVTAIIKPFIQPTSAAPLESHLSQLDNWFSRSSIEEMVSSLKSANESFANDTISLLEKKVPR